MSPTPVDWIRRHRDRAADDPVVVTEQADTVTTTTWRELADRVATLRGGLRAAGVVGGDRVALSLPNGADLVAAFSAIIAEGATAVVLPVARGHRDGAVTARTAGIWRDCRPRLLIETTSGAQLRRAHPELATLPGIALDALSSSDPVDGGTRASGADSPAFLQYTSGSTSLPKGVRVTAAMIEASCHQAADTYRETPDDVAVSWVPLSHDMGLLTALLRPLFTGYPTVLLQPVEFVTEPLRWLRALSRYRGTLSSAPDFAYAHCVRRIAPEELDGIDLSRWRIARDAGERVRPRTLDAFAGFAARAGFARTALCPSYGLAEATLTVTAATPQSPPARIRVAPETLEESSAVRQEPAGTELLSSGPPVPGTLVTIAGADGNDGIVGEIEVAGPQVAASYFSQPLRLSSAGALRTGDLGFTLDGHVFVLGRRDDVFILNGVNYFQQDLAAACSGVAGVRPGRLAAFVDDRDAGRQSVVVVAETGAGFDDAAPATTTTGIRRAVQEELGVLVSTVHYLAPGELPVTTSGKVQVAAIRDAWLSREEVRR